MQRFSTFAIVAALFATASLAQAQAPAPSAPLRGDILAQCPVLGEQLPELLASAKQQVDRQGSVHLALRVDANGKVAVEQLDGTRAYLGATRQAVEGLQCPSAPAQRYSLTVRFADDLPAKAPATRQLAAL